MLFKLCNPTAVKASIAITRNTLIASHLLGIFHQKTVQLTKSRYKTLQINTAFLRAVGSYTFSMDSLKIGGELSAGSPPKSRASQANKNTSFLTLLWQEFELIELVGAV